MITANERIWVSDRVKRELERRKRRGESFDDVLEWLLAENEPGDFYDGFGRWSDEEAATVREQRAKAKDDRKRRMRERTENRPSQAQFCCVKCGYEANADYNAAKNVGFRLLRAGQKSPHGGATRHLALKSGTLNVNGGYSPATQ